MNHIKCIDLTNDTSTLYHTEFSNFTPTHVLETDAYERDPIGKWTEVNQEKINWFNNEPGFPNWAGYVLRVIKLTDELIVVVYKNTTTDEEGYIRHDIGLYKGHLH